jgi:hypothetical protein
MRTHYRGIYTEAGVRRQPWDEAESNPEHRQYNFREHPEEVPRVLEDFTPFSQYESIQRFYDLLQWANGPDSQLETNDSAFMGPKENPQRHMSPKLHQCSGRLMFFLRNLKLNLSADGTRWAIQAQRGGDMPPAYPPNQLYDAVIENLKEKIEELYPEFRDGVVEISLFPSFYIDAPVEEYQKFGHEFVFNFWAWGDTEQETMDNLSTVVDVMRQCIEYLSDDIVKSLRASGVHNP